CRTNLMMSTVNPEQVAEVLQKIPFMVSFARQIDETVEFADIVLPDAHDFERDDFFPVNHPYAFLVPGPGDWYWASRREVVPPAGQARPWAAVLLEIAGRLGFADEVYAIANILFNLKEPYTLDRSRQYSPREIANKQARSLFGSAYEEEMFEKTSSPVSRRKKLKEAYPRPFLKARVPVYLEHFVDAGKDVQRVTRQLGIAWDVSDYTPLPDWKPCPAYEEPPDSEFDLFAVNFKLPFHTFTITTENPWLNDLSERHPYAYKILINAVRAQEKGIRDGDLIYVESRAGRVQGRVKVVQGIHPEVVGIAGTFGHWAAGKPISRDKGVHFNTLLPLEMERIDTLSGAVDACVRVRVYKA
ncbi:MAG: molybdopterin dinucleotide binding domain-containing protein, partial [bacterium]